MRKLAAFVLLCSLLAASTLFALAQTRARRVEQNVPQAPTATSRPVPAATTPNNPAKVDPSPSPRNGPPEEIGEDDVVRINTTLVTIPVSIMDRSGRYIPDLRKEDFRIYEDDIQQEVAYFAAVEKPFTVVLMLDTSSSTWSVLGRIKDAAIRFVDQLRPEDQVMVVSFASGVTLLSEATSDREAVRAAIRRTGKGLSTRLYDAVEWVINERLNRISGRKAIVLFTDGVDARSKRATYESNVRLVEELDALIYPVQYDTYDYQSSRSGSQSPRSSSRLPSIIRRWPLPFPIPVPSTGGGGSSGGGPSSPREAYDRANDYLHDIAEKTGGRVYQADKDPRSLEVAFSSIAEELRRQYSLGYYPKIQAKEGERRRIRVRVERPDTVVRARHSYIYKPSTHATDTKHNSTTTTAQDNERQPSPPVLKKPFISRR